MIEKLNKLPMRKKILISNTLMALLSMLILYFASFVMIELFENRFISLFLSALGSTEEISEARDFLKLADVQTVKEAYTAAKIAAFVVGIIFIIGTLFLNNFITKKLINELMKPLDLLNVATERIANGDYDEPINYPNEDEFTFVCNNFDKMQKILKQEREKNLAYEKARVDMISGLSHDLRTPLTSIKGFIKGIIDGVANTPEKQQRYLQIAYNKTCDMDVLISNIFEFSKIQTGNMPTFLQKTNMDSFICNYINKKKIELEENNNIIQYSTNINKNEELLCLIDQEQITRVIDNIIENSVKYAFTQELEIKINLAKMQVNNEFYASLTVADNGVGIDETKIPYIFEQFYRGDEARGTNQDGSGLGLYICKYLVEAQGGKIVACNNAGLQIQIMLPLSLSEGEFYV